MKLVKKHDFMEETKQWVGKKELNANVGNLNDEMVTRWLMS